MARNRLGEYRELGSTEPPADTVISLSPALAPISAPVQIEGLEAFLRKAESIRGIAQRLEAHTETTKALNKRLEGETIPSVEDSLKEQLDTINAECKFLIQEGRSGILQLKSSRGGDPNVRQKTFTDVSRRFRSATQLHLITENEVASSTRQRFARHIQIVRPDASEEEVRRIVDTGDLESFLTQDLTQNLGVQRRMLRDVEERKKGLDRILDSIVQLSQIVNELDAMITQQQHFVDFIEEKVESTYVNVVMANEQLSVANKHAEGARKKQWYIFAIVAAIVIILAIIITVFIMTNSPKRK
ncbi:Plasma membrane t-SNARE, secretory vesicle fusion [Dinochytrium kinnereticum]|nr:Plasma membrane t-SNARE, secretory vesicle fusion [Dinochytrium kinnereticum]